MERDDNLKPTGQGFDPPNLALHLGNQIKAEKVGVDNLPVGDDDGDDGDDNRNLRYIS